MPEHTSSLSFSTPHANAVQDYNSDQRSSDQAPRLNRHPGLAVEYGRGNLESSYVAGSSQPPHVGNRQEQDERWQDFIRNNSNAQWNLQDDGRWAAFSANQQRLATHGETHRQRSSTASGPRGMRHTAGRRLHAMSVSESDRHSRLMGSTASSSSMNATYYSPPRIRPGYLMRPRVDDYVVPRWQPDSEASECPICGKTFAFWYRKHHCRKCGRVVCANCSPHRITIPRQFIVHPPADLEMRPEQRQAGVSTAILTSESIDRNIHVDQNQELPLEYGFGDGQEVRLCNPCVPDPNPLPPPSYNQESYTRPEHVPGQDSSHGSASTATVDDPNYAFPRDFQTRSYSRRQSSQSNASQIQSRELGANNGIERPRANLISRV